MARNKSREGGGGAVAGELFHGGTRLGLTGPGRTWPSGHENERSLALETARGLGKAPRAKAGAGVA